MLGGLRAAGEGTTEGEMAGWHHRLDGRGCGWTPGEGTTEGEMAGWHHRLDGHGCGWTPGVGDGQGGLACCGSWGCKESDMTERLN